MAAALTVAVLVVLVFFAHGWSPSCGHDFGFHMQSFLAVEHAWKAGLPVPHSVMPANWGAGEPRFEFYPPLSWLVGAVLGSFLPWSAVPAAFTAVCAGGAAWAMYRVVRRQRAAGPAFAAAALYGANPYLLFNAFERTAYGELLAAVWMPLFLAALTVRPLPVARVGLLLAALWYTNAPAGVMGCWLLVFSAVFWTVWDRRGMLRHAAALALGCLLAADYLVPAKYEQRFVEITRAVGQGLRVEDSFLFKRTGEAFHDQVLHTASSIAVATVAAGLACALLWRLRARRADPAWRLEEGFDAGAVGFLASLLTLVFLLQLPWSRPVWHALPELEFLQFPWRLLLPAGAAASLLAGLAFPARFLHGKAALAAGLLVASGLTAWAGWTRFQPCDEEDTVAAHLLFAGSDAGFAGTDEYAAAGSDNGEIQQGLPRVRLLASPRADEGDDSTDANPQWNPNRGIGGAAQVQYWGPRGLAVRVRPDQAGYAVLRWERFPGWQVRVDGEPCGARCVPREDGLLTIAVPAGRWSAITAVWRTGADVWWGRGLSVCGLLVLAVLSRPRKPVMMGRK